MNPPSPVCADIDATAMHETPSLISQLSNRTEQFAVGGDTNDKKSKMYWPKSVQYMHPPVYSSSPRSTPSPSKPYKTPEQQISQSRSKLLLQEQNQMLELELKRSIRESANLTEQSKSKRAEMETVLKIV